MISVLIFHHNFSWQERCHMVLDCCMLKPVLIPSSLCHHQLHDVKRGPFLQTSSARVPGGAVLQHQSLPKPLEHLHQLPVALYQLQYSGLSILWSQCDSIWINLESPRYFLPEAPGRTVSPVCGVKHILYILSCVQTGSRATA